VTRSFQKITETNEEKQTKKKKVEEFEEIRDRMSHDELELSTNQPPIVIEVSSSTNAPNSTSQDKEGTLEADHPKHADYFHQLMDIKKKGVKIKHDVFPRFVI